MILSVNVIRMNITGYSSLKAYIPIYKFRQCLACKKILFYLYQSVSLEDNKQFVLLHELYNFTFKFFDIQLFKLATYDKLLVTAKTNVQTAELTVCST